MQSVLKLIYPERCVSCDEMVEGMFGLCGNCWGKTPFIDGTICDTCGVPLPGEEETSVRLKCDDCIENVRPWSRGRAVMLYKHNARRLVLSLKHGDRLDLVRPAGNWLAQSIAPILTLDMLVVPIPAHWTRMLSRRYNQAAMLAQAMAKVKRLEYAPDALVRPRRTKTHDGMSKAARFKNMDGAIIPHPKRGALLENRKVLLVDDVMTSGATFSAAAAACREAGACDVFTLALARVVKDA